METPTSHLSPLFQGQVTKAIKNSYFLLTSKHVDGHQVCLGPSVFAVGLLKWSLGVRNLCCHELYLCP